MLVLTRRINQNIVISDNIVVTVIAIDGGKVELGISAPDNVRVLRQEIADKIARGDGYERGPRREGRETE